MSQQFSMSQNGSEYRYTILPDAKFHHSRPLGTHHKFYEFGASMKTLGYHPIFVWGRFAKYLATGEVTGRIGAFNMLYYYLSYKPKWSAMIGCTTTSFEDSLGKFKKEECSLLFPAKSVGQFSNKDAINFLWAYSAFYYSKSRSIYLR